MNYKSISDLNRDILDWMSALPKDIDLVIGIPRSGMLAASIIGLYMNKPVADLDGFIKGHIMGVGARNIFLEKTIHKKALVIDDSILTGTSLKEAREKLERANLGYAYIFACPYAAQDSGHMVDMYYQLLPIPRIFEWNLFHHPVLTKSCMDIDGILCRDPDARENDDGENYLKFISTVPVRIKPTVTVKYLVTSRLEKYRAQTEKWLSSNGIKYEKLLMLDLPDKETRIRLGSHAKFKAEAYLSTNAAMFIESSYGQSLEIAQRAGKYVICTDSSSMVFPGDLSKAVKDSKNIYQIIKGRIKRFISARFSDLSKTAR